MLKKLSLTLIILALVIQFTCFSFAAGLNDQKNDIQSKINEIQNEQKEVKSDLSNAMKAIEDLDSNIEQNQDKIEEINDELKQLNADIANLKQELQKSQDKYDKQENSLKEKLIMHYEMGETTYLDVLLNSKGIIDFISRYYMISEVLQNDTDILDSIEEQKNKIEKDKAEVEEKQKAVKTKKAEQERTKVLLANQKTQKQKKVSELSEEDKALQSQIDKYKADLARVEAEISRQAGGGSKGGKVYTGGKLTWPCPGYSRISSTYGGRSSPGGIGSTNHKGIDMAAPHGTAILAAASGTVTLVSKTCSHDYSKTTRTNCGCGGGFGNYLMIDHGNGLTTLYAHCATISVTKGQKVSAGQQIAAVGCTGHSTGNHLHFSTLYNGSYTNPAPYLGM